ncbi:MAG: NACHT domain-containing protein [Geminicoccaceae bacterium]
MTQQRLHHRVFIASPSDVSAERQAVQEVIEDVNRLIGREKGVHLEPYLWEIDALPSLARPQDVINPELDDASIIVVIFWSKIGTPTGDAISGTMEELMRSIERHQKTGKPHVMVYFCSRAPELHTAAQIEQYMNVAKLKEAYPGLSQSYDTTDDFKKIMRENLSKTIDIVAGDFNPFDEDDNSNEEPILPDELQRYFNQVKATCGHIVLTGLLSDKSSPTVPLDEVYVSLSVTRPNLHIKPSSKQKSGKRVAAARIAGMINKQAESLKELSPSLADHFKDALIDEGVPKSDAEDQDSLSTAFRRVTELPAPVSTEQVRDALSTLSIEDAFRRAQHLLVEGIPGSGKSTILMHIAIALTKAHQGDQRAAEQLGYQAPYPIPVFVPLRQFWRWYRSRPETDRMFQSAQQLTEFLKAFLGPYLPAVDRIVPALERGDFVLLLDGMDEIPDLPGRGIAARIIADFIQQFSECGFVLTSRPAGLNPEVHAALSNDKDLAHCNVRPLNEIQIRIFIQAWYRALITNPEDASRRAAELIDRIGDNARVAELTRTPILLTAIAVVHQTRGELPERRADLYEHCVRAMCSRWDLAKGDEGRDLAGALDEYQKLGLFEEIAVAVHQNGSDAKSIERGPLLDLLVRHTPTLNGEAQVRARCETLLEELVDRTGLIIPDGDISYRFQHLSFQEYLVVRYISDRVENQINFLLERLLDPWWREVVLMSPAYKAMYATVEALRMIKDLAAGVENFESRDDQAKAYGLLSQALLDLRQYRVRGIDQAANDMAKVLLPVLEDPEQPGDVAARAEIAQALGFAPDPRLIESRSWQTVPAGSYPKTIGPSENKKPIQHSIEVSEFQISRWPVTVGEYRRFIDDGGYSESKWWSIRDWSFLQERQIEAPAFWEQQIDEAPNYPVVGVSWAEAMAYCAWLQSTATSSKLQGKLQIRLPTEAEWEIAACGGDVLLDAVKNEMPDRLFPWGHEWETKRANIADEEWLGALSPVGCFPAGHGPYDLWDQIGNVWEWCIDWYRVSDADDDTVRDPCVISEADASTVATLDYDLQSVRAKTRVIKGGGFRTAANEAEIRSRARAHPWCRQEDVGFRCVASSVDYLG